MSGRSTTEIVESATTNMISKETDLAGFIGARLEPLFGVLLFPAGL
ncbi:MAG: hypothetical protein AVDCRST_MAG28-1015 [uncultured Rubrobacteraceae bacterium]|uniref:Uncharacterized protein n=1 Tax=uncultured Rubrobacteraceae bacterium TaxID=349277 RepID=A0A6J4QRI4_9ACTN|nr:MAG: hypothetical protein AVDCRST_MAG28-1015 [uncultured Rubrobacteraceae bacterium]